MLPRYISPVKWGLKEESQPEFTPKQNGNFVIIQSVYSDCLNFKIDSLCLFFKPL